MRRQLEYKQLWRGGQVLAIPPAYTSQKCACCGHTAKGKPPVTKVNSSALNVDIQRMLISMRHVTFSGRTCRACLWREGAVRPPVEAGTRRVDSDIRHERSKGSTFCRAWRMSN